MLRRFSPRFLAAFDFRSNTPNDPVLAAVELLRAMDRDGTRVLPKRPPSSFLPPTFVDFGPMLSNPKPIQKPYPPVIVGGSYPYFSRRAVLYGDGWYALTGAKYGDEFAFIPKFHEMLSAAGRERSSWPITICLYPEELDAFAPDQIGALKRYEEFGVSRCIVGLNPEKREAILPVLDRWAEFMRVAR